MDHGGIKYKSIVFLYSCYHWSADPDNILVHQWILVQLDILVDISLSGEVAQSENRFFCTKATGTESSKNEKSFEP